MNTLTILASPEDWPAYCQQFSLAADIDFCTTRWGRGPTAYPCMVMSYLVPNTAPARIISCYVYLDDARRLVSTGETMRHFVHGPHQLPPPAGATKPNSAAQAESEAPAQPSVAACLRSLTAHVLAIVSELIGVGVTTEKRYEAAYARFLAQADQVVAEDAAVGRVVRPAGGTEDGD